MCVGVTWAGVAQNSHCLSVRTDMKGCQYLSHQWLHMCISAENQAALGQGNDTMDVCVTSGSGPSKCVLASWIDG